METPYNNVTSRRKKRNKRLYKEQSELPYGENKCVEDVGIISNNQHHRENCEDNFTAFRYENPEICTRFLDLNESDLNVNINDLIRHKGLKSNKQQCSDKNGNVSKIGRIQKSDVKTNSKPEKGEVYLEETEQRNRPTYLSALSFNMCGDDGDNNKSDHSNALLCEKSESVTCRNGNLENENHVVKVKKKRHKSKSYSEDLEISLSQSFLRHVGSEENNACVNKNLSNEEMACNVLDSVTKNVMCGVNTDASRNFQRNKNEKEEFGKKFKRKHSHHQTVDPSTKEQNNSMNYETDPSEINDAPYSAHDTTAYLGSGNYVQFVSSKEENLKTNSNNKCKAQMGLEDINNTTTESVSDLQNYDETLLGRNTVDMPESLKKKTKKCKKREDGQMQDNSMSTSPPTVVPLTACISQESINGIKMVEKHNAVKENEICSLIQTCDMQEKECKIRKKKRKLYDIQTSLFLQTSKEGCCENDSVKQFYVDNILCYPKKKHKKVDSSDLEAVCSTETHSPFTHKLFELNSDSDIDTQNKHNFMKVNNRKDSNESKLNDNKMTVSLPHGSSKHTRGFEHSMKLINKFSNENENLCEGHGKESTGIEGKNKKLTQSKERLDRTETQKCLNKPENVIEFDSVACSKLVEQIKKEQQHKDISEENLLIQKIEFDSVSCTDLPIKKRKKKNKHILEEIKPIPDGKEFDSFSCTDQVYKQNMKKTKHKNKLQKNKILQDTERSNSESCTYLPSNKIKEKKNHKYKLEVNNVLPHDNEGVHSLSSTDFSSKQIKKKKKPKNELDEIKHRLLAQALEKFKPKFVEFTDNPTHVNKKAKDKCSSLHNEVEHSMPNIDSFATRESDYIVSSNEIIVPNSVDGGDSCLHFQPSENNYLRKHSAEYVGLSDSEKMQDKKESNKKVYSISKNEIDGANEWKTTSSNQKVFLNNVSKERKLLYNTNKKHKIDNESLRAALISSALKSIEYTKTEVNNFHVDCKERSINVAAQKAVAETNEHTCNQTYTRKHKEKVKHKDKDSNKSIHDVNKKSFNTQNGKDNLRKALISAALKRMKTSERKHTKKKSTPEYEVKPKHKSKRKSSIESSVERNSKIVNEIENMRSSLIAAAIAKMSATNDVNKT